MLIIDADKIDEVEFHKVIMNATKHLESLVLGKTLRGRAWISIFNSL